MNNALAVKDQPTKSAILDIRSLSKAGSMLTALLEHLQQDRVLPEGPTQRSGVSFARIGNVVLRVTSVIEKSPIIFNWAENTVRCMPDRPTINLAVTTEAELLDVQRALELNGDGEARVSIREFLKLVRQETEPAAPLKIEIVNAKEAFAASKTLVVKRDSEGRLAGATIEPVG